MKKLLFPLVIVLAACSKAPQQAPVSGPVANEVAFSSEDAAAIAGLKRIVVQTTEKEMIGAIFKQGSMYFYTAPVGIDSEKEAEARITIPPGSSLVALYHTHPAEGIGEFEDKTEYFSATDVETAKRLHVDSFVGVIKNNNVIKYTPGVSQDVVEQDIGDNDQDVNVVVSLGSVVGKLH
jgi:hypothetical protein